MRSQLLRAFKRAFRVWWEGMGCGFPLLAPILIAIAYERVVQNQETDWDFAQDCLATYAPPGMLNTATGVCGLAAMLWLYGVAWHRPLADTIASVGTTIVASLPSAQSLLPGGTGSGDRGHRRRHHARHGLAARRRRRRRAFDGRAGRFGSRDAIRRAPRQRRDAQGRRAADARGRKLTGVRPSCAAPGPTSSSPTPMHGAASAQAQQAQGNHQEAVNAFRKAKQYDPGDRTLDAAIERSQKGIVGDFLNRYRK